jgi:hypothetical protein
MLRIFLVSFCFIVGACSAIGKQPEISFIKVAKIEKPVVDIFPSYKFKDEMRQFLEVSFSSDLEVISLSLKKDMALRVIIGLCTDFYDAPSLAFPNVYLNGKTIESYTKNENEPNVTELDNTTYQAYINYLDYEKFIRDTTDTDLCLQVRGASYASSFKSNKVKILTSHLK